MNYSLAKQIIKSPHKVGQAVGYKKLVPLHSEWIKYIWQTNESRTLQAYRGSYKTTVIVVIGTIIFCIFNPGKRVLILRKEFDQNVKPVFREISKVLRSDELRYITREIWGKPLEFKATANEITLIPPKDLRVGREANITGAAIGQSLTGQHYDRIITDDIVTLQDRISSAERERVKLIYQELNNIIDPGCPISNVGTPWHKHDAFSIMPDPVRYPIGSVPIADFTDEYIIEIRKRMTAGMYAANYELKHIADEDALFNEIQYTDKRPEGDVYAQLDARYKGKDLTALTIGSEEGGRIRLFGKAWDRHVDECLFEIVSLLKEYDVKTLCLENNADKGYLARDLERLFPSIVEYHESMNKHVKIIQFLKRKWPDVEIYDKSDPLYIECLACYTDKAEHDDPPDSAASLIREYFDEGAFAGAIY